MRLAANRRQRTGRSSDVLWGGVGNTSPFYIKIGFGCFCYPAETGSGYNLRAMDAGIVLVEEPITRERLKEIASWRRGDLVKAVIDVEKKILALGGELHADEEAFLLERGSEQKNLWGINLYPVLPGEQMVEFDSVINMRPSQNNRARLIEDAQLRAKILEIISQLVQ